MERLKPLADDFILPPAGEFIEEKDGGIP